MKSSQVKTAEKLKWEKAVEALKEKRVQLEREAGKSSSIPVNLAVLLFQILLCLLLHGIMNY